MSVNEVAPNAEHSLQDNESTLPSNDQGNTLDTGRKQDDKITISMLYEKEKKDLQRAHTVLLDEYRRRRAIRAKIMEKFGRASVKLKIVLAQTQSWSDPDKRMSKKEVITDVFVAKRYDDSETSKSERRFAYNRFNDADRI